MSPGSAFRYNRMWALHSMISVYCYRGVRIRCAFFRISPIDPKIDPKRVPGVEHNTFVPLSFFLNRFGSVYSHFNLETFMQRLVPQIAAAAVCVISFIICPLTFAHKPVQVVVHRGANAEAPENTFAAGYRCIEMGVEYVEVDVRRSADGVHYILHDSTLDRTTNGSGPINRMSSEDVDKLDAGLWYSPAFEGEKIPRLREYVEWAKGKIKIYFDVKDADLQYLVDLIDEFDLENECFFWFGNKQTARDFRELAPDLAQKINVRTAAEVRAAKEEFDMQIVETRVDNLTDEFMTTCRELGLLVMVRDGRNDVDMFQETVRRGADLINLDYPGEFLEAQAPLLSVEGVMDRVATRLYAEHTADELAALALTDVYESVTPLEREVLSTKHLQFEVNVPVTVSIMREMGQRTLPFWLEESGFTKTEMMVKNIEGWVYEVWQKSFPAGHVGLGINGFENHRPHYFVSVGAQKHGDKLELTNVAPDQFPLGWMVEGQMVYNDWTENVLGEVPEALKNQLMFTTIRGRSRATHLVGGFRKTPYPSSDTPDEVVLSWTDDPTTTQDIQWRGDTLQTSGSVRYQEVGAEGESQIADATFEVVEDRFLANDRYCHKFRATITGLRPGVEYAYQVGFPESDTWSDSATFRTAPAEPEPFSFVVYGDTQSIEPWAPILEAARKHTPEARFQLIAGDVVDTGQYRDHWDRFFHVGQATTRMWPLMPALGNHDVIDGLGAEMWRASLALPLNGPAHIEPERVYSFEYGNALVVVLDSALSIIGQAEWLENTLANSKATWKFVIYHFPPYNYEDQYPKIEALWGYLYDKYDVNIAFEGHIHYYMRSKPIFRGEPQPEGERGTTHLITIAIPNGERELPPASYAAKQFTGIAVYQEVKIDGDTMTCNTIDQNGTILDTFTVRK